MLPLIRAFLAATMAAALALASTATAAEVPADAHKGHVTILVHDDYQQRPAEARLVEALDGPQLAGLRAKWHLHKYTSLHPIYTELLQAAAPKLPAVLIQDAQGRILFKNYGDETPSGEQLPTICEKLADRLSAIKNKVCPDGKCPQPQPGPQKVEVEGTVQVSVPDRVPVETAAAPDRGFSWPVLLLSIAVAAGIAGLVQFLREAHGRG